MILARSAPRSFALPLLSVILLAGSACANSESSDPSSAGDGLVPAEDGMYAIFRTSMGDIVTRLHYEKVPVTVGNFVGLAEGAKAWTDPRTGEERTDPLYDGTTFHRVMPDFMIQGGDPLGTGTGGPGYRFMDEFDPSLRHDGPGVLSMANAGPGTNGSQFFITHKATPWLDDKHSVFGGVVAGQDVVDAIGNVETEGQNTPVEPVVLETVEIVRKGSQAEAFDAEAAFARAAEVAAERAAEKQRLLVEKLAEAAPNGSEDAIVTMENGLMYVVTEAGSGAKPTRGDTISAHYTGYLLDGTKFDSSRDRGQPFVVPIGVGNVIKGWDEAFLTMEVGETRRLMIPPELGYGAQGAGGVIPPNAHLIFDVELLDVKPQ